MGMIIIGKTYIYLGTEYISKINEPLDKEWN
jgi:hypothetical protein